MDLKTVDVGHAVFWTGKYKIPYFFENTSWRMMREPDERSISFKTFNGEYFQFYIGDFHGNPCLILTSTLKDCAFLIAPSIEGSKERAKKASEKKVAIKGSYSGYSSFGRKLLEQYSLLEEHLRQEEVYFSDDVLGEIKKELRRRAKDERSSST